MKTYLGDKPCAGCRKPGHASPRSEVNNICYACGDLLKAGKEYKAYIAQQEADCVKITLYPTHICDGQSGNSRQVVDGFLNLVSKMNLKGRKISDTIYIGGNNHQHVDVIVTKEQADEIKSFNKVLTERLNNIFEAGKKAGANLLMSLNTGELSLAKFDESLKIKG